MSLSNPRTIAAFVGGVVLAIGIALVASAAFTPVPAASPAPSKPPVVVLPSPAPSDAPSEQPTPAPTEQPTPAPTESPADGRMVVALENLTGADVSIDIEDQTGRILKAESGTPGDGMSVRWFDVNVENIDADTLRVAWVGLPRDEVVRLGVSTVDGKFRFRFVQDGPPADSDALGFDRILELSFDQPVRSEDVLTSVQESLDTQD